MVVPPPLATRLLGFPMRRCLRLITAVMWLTPDGELTEIDHSSAAERVQKMSPILCHTKSVASHLKCPVFGF